MCSYQTMKSDSIHNLRRQISHLDLILNRNHRTQRELVSFIKQLRRQNSNERQQTAFIAVDSLKAQHLIKELDLQLTTENQIDPCIYDNLLDRIQRLEQYLTKPCQHCQLSNVSVFNSNNNASDHPESSSHPIIMQGHIQNQPVTLFNRSAVELVNRLQHIHGQRNSLEKSYQNVVSSLSDRNEYISEMNVLLNKYNEQMHTIENLKYLEDVLQHQNWEDVYKSIIQIKTQALFMSKLIEPKDFNRNDNFQQVSKMLNEASGVLSIGDVSSKSNTKEMTQKERPLKMKQRKKKESPN
ncbi:unnamed protein product [Adineta ricciae]|uniref:Uncharacterized protein n=1 Tax=Adineta ricciae TaxID=249248 RepID=A0A816DHS9_ADIRI|nr:unnamed protein product [Adineta ricciae]